MKKFERCFLRFFMLVVACAGLFAEGPRAQGYPSKPIRMIVGFVAGGATDVSARLVAQKMSQRLGQNVIVDNRGGASGTIAIEAVVASPADGYTLLLMPSTIAVLPAMRTNLSYNLERDLTPISLVASGPGVLVVNPSVPARSIKELIALARSHAGKLNYASSGVGASTHLKGELFKAMAKVNIVHVPYKGSAELVIATASGEVDMSFPSLTAALPLIGSKKIIVLAVTSERRTALMPSLPTISESGLPGYDHTSWYGIFAPGGLPKDILARLNSVIVESVNGADLKEALNHAGLETRTATSVEFAALLKREIAQNVQLIKASGAKAE